MRKTEEILSKLGMSEDESSIYLYLLKKGASLGSSIKTDLNLDKSRTYDALNSLSTKGLIYKIGNHRFQKFVAVHQDKLTEIIDARVEELADVKKNIGKLMDDLDEYTNSVYKNKNIRIIDGKNGFEKWMSARLDAPKGSIIREISSNIHQSKFITNQKEFKAMSQRFPVERIAKGIHMRALMTKDDIENFPHLRSVETTDPALLKEVRLLPDNFEIEAGLQTYGNYVSFMRSFGGEFLGIIIEDKFLTSLINNMFDFIWNQSKQI